MKPNQTNIERYGGKGANLYHLLEENLPVPPFFIIETGHINHEGLRAQTQADLKTFLEKNSGEDFAVRSSAVVEDGPERSYAGQFKTFLHVKAPQVAEKAMEVWSSASAESVSNYHEAGEISMAVVIQRMVPSEVSGVVFGINPVNGSSNETVISSTYGLGEGLVSGELDGDTFVFKQGGWESEIATKKSKLVFGQDKLEQVDVDEEDQQKSSLTEYQCQELKQLSDRLGEKLGAPQDIEFCYLKGQLYVLQTRPVTSIVKGDRKIWDSSNIIESYPGVTTPLTFSFILRMYQAVYEQLSTLLGVPSKRVQESEKVYAQMLGLLRGRVYYNLINWYRALAMVPGFALNARFMEKMMGTAESFDLPPEPKNWKTRLYFVRSIFKLISAYRGLPKQTEKFLAHLNGVMKEYNSLDMETLEVWELMERIKAYQEVLLKQWKAPLVNDFFAMIFFGLFQKSIEKWYSGPKPQLHNDLLIGSSDIISAEPIRFFQEVDELIKADSEIFESFSRATEVELWESIQGGERGDIGQRILHYLERFGDRSVGELKLETETFRQRPELLIRQIKENLKLDLSGRQKTNPAGIRKEAEQELFTRVRGPKRWTLRYLLKNTRRLVSNRENLRYERTRAFGMMRRLFLTLGEKMKAANLLEEARDIFYLEEGEIFNYFDGTASTIDLKALTTLRKNEYKQYGEELPLPERIETFGWVYRELKPRKPDGESNHLSGLACCSGIVRAKVRVIHDPKEAKGLNGEILVTSSTDPGWISLFYGAAGILVERGSLLSHSAIVSREMGIPCIVSVRGLMSTLRDGDEVEMNGATGEIEILRPQTNGST